MSQEAPALSGMARHQRHVLPAIDAAAKAAGAELGFGVGIARRQVEAPTPNCQRASASTPRRRVGGRLGLLNGHRIEMDLVVQVDVDTTSAGNAPLALPLEPDFVDRAQSAARSRFTVAVNRL